MKRCKVFEQVNGDCAIGLACDVGSPLAIASTCSMPDMTLP